MSSVLDDKNRKKAKAGEEYIEQNGKRYKKVNFDEIPNNHAAAREAGYTIFRNSNGGIIGALEGAEANNKGNYFARIGGEWYEVVDNPIAKKAGRTFGTAQPATTEQAQTPVATEAASQKEETPAAPDTQASDDVIDLEGVEILGQRSQKKDPETTFPKNVSPFDSAGTRIPNESARNAGVSKLDDYYHRSVLETLPETPAAQSRYDKAIADIEAAKSPSRLKLHHIRETNKEREMHPYFYTHAVGRGNWSAEELRKLIEDGKKRKETEPQIPQTPVPAAPTAVEDVQQNEDGGKITILWPERPEMEKGNYVEQTDAQIAQAQKSAAEQERRAKRDRDMAIISDIANLVTKGAAMHGGAWKIDKEEARSAAANDRLRALRESNSKLLAEYARQRMEAADAARKERNAEKKAEYDAAVNKAKLEASIARNNAELKERQEHNDVMEAIAKQNADTKEAATGKNGSKSGNGKTATSDSKKNIRYIDGWAFDIDSAAEVDEAYAKMVQADENKAVKKPSYVNPKGYEVVENPSTAQKRDALTKGGMTATPPKKNAVSGANKGKTAGFSSGKKAGFK